jgi:hypothetical protein
MQWLLIAALTRIELCLRDQEIKKISIPHRTYISVPFLANKLGIELRWRDEEMARLLFYWRY